MFLYKKAITPVYSSNIFFCSVIRAKPSEKLSSLLAHPFLPIGRSCISIVSLRLLPFLIINYKDKKLSNRVTRY